MRKSFWNKKHFIARILEDHPVGITEDPRQGESDDLIPDRLLFGVQVCRRVADFAGRLRFVLPRLGPLRIFGERPGETEHVGWFSWSGHVFVNFLVLWK